VISIALADGALSSPAVIAGATAHEFRLPADVKPGCTPVQSCQAAQTTPAENAWKFLRSPDPRGGPDAVSISRTAELGNSDADIAGLMLRCAGQQIETVIVVIDPRTPRSRPHIKLSANGANASFEATVVPPFSVLLLPREATQLLLGQWLSSPALNIEIENQDQARSHAVVLLAGLRAALDRLRNNCGLQ
jgi:hypothetical protein